MNTLKFARNKYIIIKKILALDNKYTNDYLMSWRKKDLLDYYNTLVIKNNKKEKESARNN